VGLWFVKLWSEPELFSMRKNDHSSLKDPLYCSGARNLKLSAFNSTDLFASLSQSRWPVAGDSAASRKPAGLLPRLWQASQTLFSWLPPIKSRGLSSLILKIQQLPLRCQIDHFIRPCRLHKEQIRDSYQNSSSKKRQFQSQWSDFFSHKHTSLFAQRLPVFFFSAGFRYSPISIAAGYRTSSSCLCMRVWVFLATMNCIMPLFPFCFSN